MTEVQEYALGLVVTSLNETKYCEHDRVRVVYWSWCTIGEYDTVLVSKYNFSPHDLSEHHEDHAGTTHVLTAVFEQTVGREPHEEYDYIGLVDGDHWFISVDDEIEIVDENLDSQPSYYGGPRDEAAIWVASYGELHTIEYEDGNIVD